MNNNNEIFTWGQGKVCAHHFPCFSKLFNLRHLLEKFYEFYVSVIVIWILFNLQTERISRTVLVKGRVHQRTSHERPEVKQMYSSTISLTSGLHRGQWSTWHPSCFTPRKEILYPLYRSLGGLRASLDRCRKSRPHLDSISKQSRPIYTTQMNYQIVEHFSVLKHVNFMKFTIGVSAELVHIMWISQHYRIISVPKSNMKKMKVNMFTNIEISVAYR